MALGLLEQCLMELFDRRRLPPALASAGGCTACYPFPGFIVLNFTCGISHVGFHVLPEGDS